MFVQINNTSDPLQVMCFNYI